MAFRGAIPDFQLANPLYVGATVSFFTVDASGEATTTLASLFANPTGTQTVTNPQTLDSEGKFAAPVYIEIPVIAEVTGPNVPSHATGVINARGTWRGNYATAMHYYSTDFIIDPVSGNVYAGAVDFTSTSLAADIAAGNLVLVIDQTAIVSGGAALAIKAACQCKTTGNVTLSGLQVIDGYQQLNGDRTLVANQSNPAQNGLYNAHPGAWTRTLDTSLSVMWANGVINYVINGTLAKNRGFQANITTPFTVDASAVTFTDLILPQSEIVAQMGNAPDAVLLTGIKGYLPVAYDCTIVGATLIGDGVGSIVIDIYNAPYANFPPGPGNSIVGAAPPTLANQQITQDTTLAGWTKALKAGSVLGYNIVSVAGLKFAHLALQVTRN